MFLCRHLEKAKLNFLNIFIIIREYQILSESIQSRGPGSSVGIATGYGLGDPGIESRWGTRFYAPVQTGPETHPASCKMGTGAFLGGKEWPRRDADPTSPSSAAVMKE